MTYSRPARATGTSMTVSPGVDGAFIAVILRTRAQRLEFGVFQDPAYQLLRARHRRVEREVRRLRVKRRSLRQQRSDARMWIGGLQERARLVVDRAAGDFVGACLQVDN